MILQDSWMNVPISYFSSYDDATIDADMFGIKANLYLALSEKVNPFVIHYNQDAFDIDLNVFNNLAIHVYKLLQYDKSFPLRKTCDALVCFPHLSNQMHYFEYLVKDHFEFDQKYSNFKYELTSMPKDTLWNMINTYFVPENEFNRDLIIGKFEQIDR